MHEYVDRVAIRDELYEADAITMEGVGILNRFPAADVVEVVRCKDCICFEEPTEDFDYTHCYHSQWDDSDGWARAVNPNDFCSYGERKDERS